MIQSERPPQGVRRFVRFCNDLRGLLRFRLVVLVDRYMPGTAERLFRIAEIASAFIFRSDERELPEALFVDGKPIDVIEDLVAFTGLDVQTVEANVRSHKYLSFRAEWYATPKELRSDRWFYLSSKSYLFGNASHFTSESPVMHILPNLVRPPALVWDFGAGAGQLTVQLVACGYTVVATELNALQLEFLRFRARKHTPVTDRLEIFHASERKLVTGCAAIVAMDVLEHLSDPATTLLESIIPSLAPNGILLEDSPFGANVSNPMHHSDFGFPQLMEEQGFSAVWQGEGRLRAWARPDFDGETLS